MMQAQAPVQIAILCRNCMGRAEPSADGSLVCPFCGVHDRLPEDQLGRALELERRRAAARQSVVNVDGMNAALAEIFEQRSTFWRIAWIYIAAPVLVIAMSIANSWSRIAEAPPALRVGIVMQSLVGSLWWVGMVVAIAVGIAVGRRRYRARVRPHLLARCPRLPGLPARCRACNADLPNGPEARGAFVQCEYCSTRSLVTPEIQAHQQGLLDDERAFYERRAAVALGGMRSVSNATSRIFGASFLLTYAAMIGLQALAQHLR